MTPGKAFFLALSHVWMFLTLLFLVFLFTLLFVQWWGEDGMLVMIGLFAVPVMARWSYKRYVVSYRDWEKGKS